MSKEVLYLFSGDLTDESQFLTCINHANVEILSGLKSLHFSFKMKLCMKNKVNVREELGASVWKSKQSSNAERGC